jgi:hypothetical protein
MKSPYDVFDQIAFSTVLRPHSSDDLEKIRASADDVTDNKKHRDFIFQIMNALDTKASALLTHISIIIAVLSVIYTNGDKSEAIKSIIVIEIIGYLLLTFFCLRAVRMTSGLSNKGASETEALQIELYQRRTAYNFASSGTIIITAIMMLTLLTPFLHSLYVWFK